VPRWTSTLAALVIAPLGAAVGCTPVDPTDDTDAIETGDPLDALRLAEINEVNGEHAASSEVCYWCHANTTRSTSMRDSAGQPVSPWDLWRGSMMANSARDPFFRATLSVEQAAFPDQARQIGQDCMRCHAPAGFAEATLSGQDAPEGDAMEHDDTVGMLARDGATCVSCHMLDPSAAGGSDTWSGHHVFDTERRLYGPHPEPVTGPMQGFAEYTPTRHPDYGRSGMCASCHMLQTQALHADGTPTGHVLTEQAPFVEWRSSAFASEGGATCQECHLPRSDADGNPIATRIARSSFGVDSSSLQVREPYGRHLMVGGNAFALEVIYDYRYDLGAGGPGPSMQVAIDETRHNLTQAASLELGPARLVDQVLQLPVRVNNQAGHKLPTGYPTRRVWLEVQVTDATGATVAHVGAVDARGRLLNAAGEPLPSELADGPVLPHVDVITHADAPQVWQSWMQTADGAPTTRLLRGATYAKDDRILPAGFAPDAADLERVGPVGTSQDDDFVGGSDTVDLRLPVQGQAPLTATVTLRYQAYSPRALDELLAVSTPQTRALAVMLEDRGVPAEVIAQDSVIVGEE